VKLAGRIPVEPLDDERMTNIERKIVAGAADAAAMPVRESRFSTAMAFAAAAIVAVLGAGAIGWKLRGGGGAPAVAAAEVAPIQVRTDEHRSTLDIGDAKLQSDPETAFTITRPDGGVLITMTRGKVSLDVGKRGNRPPLVVKAGDTDVVVVGTQFSVDYGDGTGDVDVRVTEGVVRVVRHKQETRVAAGQAWTKDRGLVALGDLGARRAGARSAGGDATIANAGDVNGNGNDGNGAGGSEAGDGLEIDMGDAPDVLRDRVATVPDVRAPQQGAAGRAGASSGSSGGGGRGGEAGGRRRPLDDPKDPSFDLKSLIRSQPVLPALDVGEPDALKAMAEYRQIMMREKGANEAHAFYSMAVIQALKLGRTGDALVTLSAFKRRAPTSEFYLPALWLEVRIKCLRNIDDECRQAAEIYKRRASEGPTLHVAEKITLTK
jgi:hypothetical protein